MAMELAVAGIAPLSEFDTDVSASDYVQTRGWLYADQFAVGRSAAAMFRDEAALWQAALGMHDFYETRQLTLDDIVLTDWVPRSPGRYHTGEAAAARAEAQHRILERHRDYVVYDPWGKTSMVVGGVGCLRLAVKTVGGQQVKFLGATSSGIVHRGFVVALDRNQYASIAEFIEKRGGVRCTVTGTVRYWNPDEKLDIFSAADLPRVYLGVDELRRAALSPTDLPPLEVTPAITFEADGQEYFTYSPFRPADSASVNRAVEWMSEYVVTRYHGRVTTDFDELVTRFADTAVPLKTLMNRDVPLEQITPVLGQISERAVMIITNNFREVTMGDKYEISGSQVGAVGRGAHAQDMTFVQQSQEIDIQALAEELGRLRIALRERGTDAEHDLAVGEIAAAEAAARQGDTEGTLRHLKQAGEWALGVATEIGVPVATAALKSLLG